MRIAFINPQGNFDPLDRYWTEHPDFGGQLVYVKEVAQALARLGHQVDIFTRRVQDPNWAGFESAIDGYPGVDNLRIVRISFGGDQFLRKEDLWPHLEEFVEGIEAYYHNEKCKPDCITTHYGDGGLAGALLQERMGVPFTFTGHSLGAQKMDKLKVQPESMEEINDKYHFNKRIYGERVSMQYSAVNIVSTDQERFQQYSHPAYQGAIDPKSDDRFAVIPPGVNTRIFNQGEVGSSLQKKIQMFLQRDCAPERQELPCIVASSRLDPKKNHLGLVQAYAESPELQSLANLCIVLRGLENPLENYGQLQGVEGQVLTEIIQIIKEANLLGKVVFVDLGSQQELAGGYRYFAERGGLFVLTALYEPFGLAPLEAAACGLPVVVTQNGGPAESLREGEKEYGVLVDPESTTDIARGLYHLLADQAEWKQIQQAGLQRIRERYTWEKTAANYIQAIEKVLASPYTAREITKEPLSLEKLSELYFEKGE